PLLRGLHRFSVVALELRVMIPQALDLLSQRTRVPALTDDEGDGADEGDEESPEQWVPCVFRHKTLFRRLTAGLLIVPSLRAVADRPPGLPPGPSQQGRCRLSPIRPLRKRGDRIIGRTRELTS